MMCVRHTIPGIISEHTVASNALQLNMMSLEFMRLVDLFVGLRLWLKALVHYLYFTLDEICVGLIALTLNSSFLHAFSPLKL